MTEFKEFAKKEIVLIISFVLAVASMFIVPPSKDYLGYIDYRTLALLFSLMVIVAGFQSLGIFNAFADTLLRKANKMRQLYFVLVLLCFFMSMVITNDVALITFVPFTIVTLNIANRQKMLSYIIVMETIAANLGSMLTPIGNPQNLYLFSFFNMNGGDFVKTILPYSLLSLALLCIGSLFCKNEKIKIENTQTTIGDKRLLILYIVLLVVTLLSVFRIVPYVLLLPIVILSTLIFDKKCFCKVDYSLLFTFAFLFVFIGNLGNIETVSNYLKNIVAGNEVAVGIISSQVLSNVPACILIFGFTENVCDLLIGVNLGGLGTLIASMASLISFKLISKENIRPIKYVALFTIANIIFLLLNIILYFIISGKIF